MSAFKQFLAVTLFVFGGGCAVEPKVNGRSASEVFSDPAAVRLVNLVCEGRYDELLDTRNIHQSINIMGDDGTTPLFWAISCNSYQGVTILIDKGANPNHRANVEVDSITPVVVASSYDDSRILDVLLRNGGSPNIPANNGEDSALSVALSKGDIDGKWSNYYLLISHGADLNYSSPTGRTIASHAVALGWFSKVVELLDYGYNRDLYRLAVDVYGRNMEESHPEYIHKKLLIDKLDRMGVDVKLARKFVMDKNKEAGVDSEVVDPFLK